ncbi:MAG: hypothetical protein Q7V19_16420, partial [Bacteroidales bacterium]|nr:hypothetical protein [Bacteroidales bacterium]
TEKILSANLVHPDTLISEVSAWTLFQYNKEYYEDIMFRLRKSGNRRILQTENTVKARSENKAFLLFEKIALLKGTELFSTVPETDIIGFLTMFPKIHFEKNLKIENHVDQKTHNAYLRSDNGIVISFPLTALYEFMTSTSDRTEKLLSINQIQTIN